ncbi:unnamed protein product [Camellia sinensis]
MWGFNAQTTCRDLENSSSDIPKIRNYELGSAQDLSLQRHFRTLYVRLMGALSLQYSGGCVDVVRLPQWVSICN